MLTGGSSGKNKKKLKKDTKNLEINVKL